MSLAPAGEPCLYCLAPLVAAAPPAVVIVEDQVCLLGKGPPESVGPAGDGHCYTAACYACGAPVRWRAGVVLHPRLHANLAGTGHTNIVPQGCALRGLILGLPGPCGMLI